MVDKLMIMGKRNTMSEVSLLQNDNSICRMMRRVEFEPEKKKYLAMRYFYLRVH